MTQHGPDATAPELEKDLEAQVRAEHLEDLALEDDYGLNPRYVERVIDAADRGDEEHLRELVAALHPADVADLMGFLSPAYRESLVPLLDSAALAEILPELEDNIREDVLEQVPAHTLASALGDLDSDDAADVVDDLEDDKRDAVLAAMSHADRTAIEASLGYADETAGRLMQREVIAAPQFWTVGQTLEHLRSAQDHLPELFFDVYVVDPSFRPIGAAPVSRLITARPEQAMAQIMEPVTELTVDQDQEEVAYAFEKYRLISAPVVDKGGRLVGQITVDDIVGVIREESEEDTLALAGVSDVGRDASIFEITKSRFWWLLVNLGTAVLAASVIALFQGQIEKLVALAVLNPIAASMGGNAGTQTVTVAVRALATRELSAANVIRTIWRETAVGMLNGVAFAIIMGGITGVWFHDLPLAVVVGLAMVINLFCAAVAGILIPLVLDKMGHDPAVSSVVFLTTVTDCVGYFSFLGLATVLILSHH
ncbi:MAG TPA: magnesium transporter [Caulobacteraceae bacterium]|jgi:magnesium transporter